MQKLLFLIIVLLSVFCGFAQDKPVKKGLLKSSDSTAVRSVDTTTIDLEKRKEVSLMDRLLKDDSKDDKANVKDYLIISHNNDTTYVDTTLTIHKDYKFNYLRKDNFGLMPFSNLGQTYNSLTYNFQDNAILPRFGARARHFNYMEIEDIYYYRVPTPFTELFYKTAFEQGQLADSFFTVNTSPQFNFSIAYKGLRSLGQYQHIVTSTGNFRVTTNYTTKNKRYNARGHIVMQDLLNEENGGLQDDDVPRFISGEAEFLDRAIFDPNFENAESVLKGKRFHLDHQYQLIRKDSTSSHQLNIKHIISFEDKSFQYDQSSRSPLFGEAFSNSGLRDRVTLERLYNMVEANYSNKLLGDIAVSVSNTDYNYGYDKIIILNENTIINRIKGNVSAVGAKYQKVYEGFNLKGEAGLNIVGDFSGNYIKGEASYNLAEDILAKAMISHNSKAPNFNVQLYQSDYQDYNWQNNFGNTESQQLAFQIRYKKLANLIVDYSTISDYIYFKQDETVTTSQSIKPFQNNATINYFRAKLENEITVGKFALNNTVLYQNVKDDNNVFNVPEIVTRNTFYFSSHLFKKAMFLQTGVTLNYFTKYFMNGYNPVLSEFYVQNETEIGEFPRLDFFLNAKIRQTRIFFKAEHFNSALTGYDYFAAPNYPYRDFTIRFGLVWNFFM
ncbi:MAG: putative porin [Jejuia sp.]